MEKQLPLQAAHMEKPFLGVGFPARAIPPPPGCCLPGCLTLAAGAGPWAPASNTLWRETAEKYRIICKSIKKNQTLLLSGGLTAGPKACLWQVSPPTHAPWGTVPCARWPGTPVARWGEAVSAGGCCCPWLPVQGMGLCLLQDLVSH